MNTEKSTDGLYEGEGDDQFHYFPFPDELTKSPDK